jgi:hypothetical protein
MYDICVGMGEETASGSVLLGRVLTGELNPYLIR